MAANYSELMDHLPTVKRLFMAQFQGSFLHARASEQVAHLACRCGLFLRFAVDSEAISGEEADGLWHKAWEAITGMAMEQREFTIPEGDAHRFIALLRSAVATGRCHYELIISTKRRYKTNRPRPVNV
ncbi:MAG: hypothetical protein QF473_11300 [Planctomycetota bacterium]|jgi:hypothetical protein|nr:hypothetical protein [Planctomycetota bacterium]